MCGHKTQFYHLLSKIRTLLRVHYYYSVKCKPELICYHFSVISKLLNIFCTNSIPLRLKGRDYAGYFLTPNRTYMIKKRFICFKNFLGERSYQKGCFFFNPSIFLANNQSKLFCFVLCVFGFFTSPPHSEN